MHWEVIVKEGPDFLWLTLCSSLALLSPLGFGGLGRLYVSAWENILWQTDTWRPAQRKPPWRLAGLVGVLQHSVLSW